MSQKIIDSKDKILSFEHKNKHTWCSGCGNFGIISALKRALALEDIPNHQVMLCYDVGCNGNESDKINAYTIHGLHGRVLPLAAGVSLANPELPVIAQAGDGATFSEGINHLVHAIRNNYNITFICHNNSNYGLTIGQASSTTPKGVSMSASPDGVLIDPINTIDFVLSCNPTFVARSFSGDIEHMTKIIQAGIRHQGFSYVEVMQVCPTFNKATPQNWYWDKLSYLTQDNHDSQDIWEARKKASDMEKEISVGVFYQNQNSKKLYDLLPQRQGLTTTPVEEVRAYPIDDLIKEFV